MTIKKQEFYEGAALHIAARTGGVSRVRYETPFFVFNDQLFALLKYSTRGRSPWGFTFTVGEQNILQARGTRSAITIGLICGADGVAAIGYDSYLSIAAPRNVAIHLACYRGYGEHYEISGPDGTLDRKVAPSNWQKLFEQ
jgi:hypothetical protein